MKYHRTTPAGSKSNAESVKEQLSAPQTILQGLIIPPSEREQGGEGVDDTGIKHNRNTLIQGGCAPAIPLLPACWHQSPSSLKVLERVCPLPHEPPFET